MTKCWVEDDCPVEDTHVGSQESVRPLILKDGMREKIQEKWKASLKEVHLMQETLESTTSLAHWILEDLDEWSEKRELETLFLRQGAGQDKDGEGGCTSSESSASSIAMYTGLQRDSAMVSRPCPGSEMLRS